MLYKRKQCNCEQVPDREHFEVNLWDGRLRLGAGARRCLAGGSTNHRTALTNTYRAQGTGYDTDVILRCQGLYNACVCLLNLVKGIGLTTVCGYGTILMHLYRTSLEIVQGALIVGDLVFVHQR